MLCRHYIEVSMRELPGFLDAERTARELSIAEIHRRLVSRGHKLPLSSVWRFFCSSPKGYTPSPGQLYLIGETLGFDDGLHVRALQAASRDVLRAGAHHASPTADAATPA
jgi:hypothetical protein